ncbi:MAG: dihydrolipoyl dehydrogenase [Coriobacteriia bacterium]|nr:dihydrolipoyl dehydrogenase [Coriobacteriia bacterium]
MESYDVIVIGAGPGGYVAAIHAAQLGASVAIVEGRAVGGTCLNRGCVPTKALLHVASTVNELSAAENYGVQASHIDLDFDKITEYKNMVVETQTKGVAGLLKANGVESYHGYAQIQDQKKVLVDLEDGSQLELSATKGIVIATGSEPNIIPLEGVEFTLTSDDLLEGYVDNFESITIVGGGVIGVEMASYYASMGVSTTLLQGANRILPRMDKDASSITTQNLKKLGARVVTEARVKHFEQSEEGVVTVYDDKKGEEQRVLSEEVLLAIGRKAYTKGLFADGFELEMERGAIVIDKDFKTSVDGVYAIGDVIFGSVQLAHVASFQGEHAVEAILLDKAHERALELVPSVIYTSPEVSSVGLSEDEAKAAGYELMVGKYLMNGNCRTVIAQAGRGYIKTIFDKETERLLGVSMVAVNASEIMNEASNAIANKLTYSDLLKAMRPHPSFGEGFTEAILAAKGEAIHMAPPKK